MKLKGLLDALQLIYNKTNNWNALITCWYDVVYIDVKADLFSAREIDMLGTLGLMVKEDYLQFYV